MMTESCHDEDWSAMTRIGCELHDYQIERGAA